MTKKGRLDRSITGYTISINVNQMGKQVTSVNPLSNVNDFYDITYINSRFCFFEASKTIQMQTRDKSTLT